MATERNKQISARTREIYAALCAKRLQNPEAGIPVPALGKDAITLAALRRMKEIQHIELTEHGVARLTGQGLEEAFRIETADEEKPARA